MKHFLGGRPTSEIWVPHLRRGLIATKVGHRAKHDPLSLAKTPTRRSRLFTHPPLSPSFPFREHRKNKLQKSGVFFAPKKPPRIHHVSPRIHHDFTIKTPSQNTHFFPNPFKNARKSAASRHPTSAIFFLQITAKHPASEPAPQASSRPAPSHPAPAPRAPEDSPVPQTPHESPEPAHRAR
jgi:hypothetical protein